VKATSSRVSDVTENETARKTAEVTSNEIDVEIVAAEREWQQRELQRIVTAVDDLNIWDVTRDSGGSVNALRYLGTEQAARELA
jgi:hypothetical protein